jgi:hypothetical protein
MHEKEKGGVAVGYLRDGGSNHAWLPPHVCEGVPVGQRLQYDANTGEMEYAPMIAVCADPITS